MQSPCKEPIQRTSSSNGSGSADVTGFYEPDTGSIQYVVADPKTGKAALIDVVLNFEPQSARFSTEAAESILQFVEEQELEVEWILDTHPHADHAMASAWLKDKIGAPTAIGAELTEIIELWRDIYHLPDAFSAERDFDHLLEDGAKFMIGELPVRVMLSPGHTLGSITYVVGDDAAFVHDTFMYVDSGTARADFPGGDAGELYDSLMEILDLPDETRLFVGHDYCGDGTREPRWEATVAEHKRDNKHLGGGTSRDEYVRVREERDRTLVLPDRMLHVIQVNLRGGRLPQAESDGRHYLKIPVNHL